MPISPCASCGGLYVGKMPTFYFGWHTQDGERLSFKVRLCPKCAEAAKFSAEYAVPVKDGYMQLPTTCRECSTPIDSLSVSPFFATVYGPEGRLDLAYAPCAECLGTSLAWIREHGELLEDRAQPAKPQRAGRGAPRR